MAQLNSLIVTGNSRFLNPINGNARNGVYYVKGTQTAATGAWTGVIPIPALYDGLTIMYYLPYAPSGNATLNLTLSNGTTTGAINCYYSTSRLTTHYGKGSNIVMTYHSAGSISVDGTATTDNRWIANADYNTTYSTMSVSELTTGTATTSRTVRADYLKQGIEEIIEDNISNKMDKVNPTGSGSFSLNRKAGTSIGTNSFAEGTGTTASGSYSHAEGSSTIASGPVSHTEGAITTANGSVSHAEGSNTTASGDVSHAEGTQTTASGDVSHAEGAYTNASGDVSHAGGFGTTASGMYSHADGLYSTANHKSQHVFGEYNALDNSSAAATERGNYVEIVGNGTADDSRSNARTLDWSGNEVLSGTIEATGFGTTLLNLIYPVGSIFMSVNNVNPGTYLTGTTWEAWGSGRVPVGVDSNDTSFDTVEETGGGKTTSYTPAGAIGGTKLTAAQSGVPAHSHGLNSHTHTVGAHKHGLNSHTHTIPALSGTAANKTLDGAVDFAPNITLNGPDAEIIYTVSGVFSSTKTARQQAYVSGSVSPATTTRRHRVSLDASHTHSVTTVANTTGKASGSTENSSAFNTGAASGSTANNTANAASETHTHTWTGTAQSISTVQPYITCYMWKRTA